MGLMGVLGLWILGSPYNWGGLGCKFLQELKTEISILPSLRSFFRMRSTLPGKLEVGSRWSKV